MIEIVFSLFIAAATTGIGWALVSRLDSDRLLTTAERFCVSFITGLYGIYFGVFVIGPYRLDAISIGGLALVIGAAGALLMPWRSVGCVLLNEWKEARSNWVIGGLWGLICIASASSVLQALAPPNDYDALLYHLVFPRFDVEQGFIGIPWERDIAQATFPAMTSNLTRFSLVLLNDRAAQMLHALFGLIAAAGAASLILRLSYGKVTALIAALFFLVVRGVVWQMGSVETDVPLAAFSIFAVVVYLAWRQRIGWRLGVLFGLMLGGAILTKLIGFAVAAVFAPLMLIDFYKSRSVLRFLSAPITALFVLSPHVIRNFLETGNPLFPILNGLFNPGSPDFEGQIGSEYGTGLDVMDYLAALWNVFIFPIHHFDGMVIGSPYLLALAPLILLDREKMRRWVPIVLFFFLYFFLWYGLLSRQVRFLFPVLPILCAMAAAGLTSLWERASSPFSRGPVVVMVGILALNQAAFVGIYAAIRLPVALGLVSEETYMTKTPTMGGAYYTTCSYISEHLKPGERYFSVTAAFHSYYCPQVQASYIYFRDEAKWWLASKTPPHLSIEEFIQKLEMENPRFVIMSNSHESRRGLNKKSMHQTEQNLAAKPVMVALDQSHYRGGSYLAPVFQRLTPVFQGRFTSIYDGQQVVSELKQLNEN